MLLDYMLFSYAAFLSMASYKCQDQNNVVCVSSCDHMQSNLISNAAMLK